MTDPLAYPGTRQWWYTRKSWHTDEFACVVDRIVARGNTPQAYEATTFETFRYRLISQCREQYLAPMCSVCVAAS
jgi:hypothetical protein